MPSRMPLVAVSGLRGRIKMKRFDRKSFCVVRFLFRSLASRGANSRDLCCLSGTGKLVIFP
jgi:hypothetical protein